MHAVFSFDSLSITIKTELELDSNLTNSMNYATFYQTITWAYIDGMQQMMAQNDRADEYYRLVKSKW